MDTTRTPDEIDCQRRHFFGAAATAIAAAQLATIGSAAAQSKAANPPTNSALGAGSSAASTNKGASYVGRVLSRTYRLDRLLVAGGIGSVYLARHLRTGGPCAVKVLHRESAQNQELYRRFLDEARVTVALRPSAPMSLSVLSSAPASIGLSVQPSGGLTCTV